MSEQLKIKIAFGQVFNKQSGTSQAGKQWTKWSFVGTTQEQYSKTVAFDTMNAGVIQQIESITPGDIVTVFFNLESREWQGKYFTTANCWKCGIETTASAPAQTYQQPAPVADPGDAFDSVASEDDGNLPF